MKEDIRLINIATGMLKDTIIDRELGIPQGFLEVPLHLYGKNLEIVEGNVQEKFMDIVAIRKQIQDYFNKKFLDFQNQSYTYIITSSAKETFSIQTSMDLGTLNYYKLCTLKTGDLIELQVILANTGLKAVITITRAELDKLRTHITNKLSVLENLDTLIFNEIETASNELCQEIYELSTRQLDTLTDIIVTNHLEIAQMSLQTFDSYIKNLLPSL